MVLSALNPRHRSLPRGITLVLGSLVLAFLLAGFPDDRPSLKLLIPTIAAVLGTWDTIRCLRHRWSFYHGAVVVPVNNNYDEDKHDSSGHSIPDLQRVRIRRSVVFDRRPC